MSKKTYKVNRPMYLFYIKGQDIIRKKCHTVLKQKYHKSEYNPFYYFLDEDFHSNEEQIEFRNVFLYSTPRERDVDTVCFVATNKNMLSFSDSVENYRANVIELIEALRDSAIENYGESEGYREEVAEEISKILSYKVIDK